MFKDLPPQTVDPRDPAIASRNRRTAFWVLLVIGGMMALSFFTRHLMMPVLFKM